MKRRQFKPSPPRIAEPRVDEAEVPAKKAAKKKTGRADKAAKGGKASLAGAERLLESLARGGTGSSPARLEPSGGAMQEPSGIAAEPEEPDERSVRGGRLGRVATLSEVTRSAEGGAKPPSVPYAPERKFQAAVQRGRPKGQAEGAEMRSILDHCAGAEELSCDAGDVLLAEGEKSGRLFVLVEGAVEVLRGNTQVAVMNEPGARLRRDVGASSARRTPRPCGPYRRSAPASSGTPTPSCAHIPTIGFHVAKTAGAVG